MIEGTPLFSGAQVKALDRHLIEVRGIPGLELMNRAGEAAFQHLRKTWPKAKKLLVVCGTGNNGGDGWVVARCAAEAELTVSVALVGDPSRILGDARRAMDAFLQTGGDLQSWSTEATPTPEGVDVVIDALLGIGVNGQLRPVHQTVLEHVNGWELPVLSLDVPSGLSADTGLPLPVAIKASQTITFIGAKRGLYTGQAGDHTGVITLEPLVDNPIDEGVALPDGYLMDAGKLTSVLPRRGVAHHKGRSGHVLVVGGNTGFAGAAILAARAALRSGAGLVSLASQPATANAAVTAQPEIMAKPVVQASDLAALIDAASVVIVGPGLGQDAWANMCLATVLERAKQAVFDADALNLLALDSSGIEGVGQRVYTPHPGEAARMLQQSTAAIGADRFGAVEQLASMWGGVVVLKGWGTLVGSTGAPLAVCPHGNSAMAVGGMGDVLAGVIGAFIAQGMSIRCAAEAGAVIHGLCGDRARREIGPLGVLPSDVTDRIPKVLADGLET